MSRQHILLLTLLLTLLGCTKPSKFKITGEMSDGSNTNLYVRYYDGTAVQTDVTVARDGKFMIELSSQRPTVLEMLSNDMTVLARMYVQNGDEVNVTVNRQNPLTSIVTGTEVNERWTNLMSQNAELLAASDHEAINTMIEDYITEHPDDIVSGLMFTTFYDSSIDPGHSMQVFEQLSAEARTAGAVDQYLTLVGPYDGTAAQRPIHRIRYRTAELDSVVELRPSEYKASLIVLSNENSNHKDSVVPHIKEIYGRADHKRTQILDMVLYNDTISMKRVVRNDSAKWIQGWAPGGLLGPDIDSLAIPRLPFYIVADSAGRQVYRGTSPTEAERVFKSY